MSILTQTKKAIALDWLREFPELSSYTQNVFLRIVGPIIIGIEIVKLPFFDKYRPHFVCYALWKQNIKECMDTPLIYQEIKTKNGLQFAIPYTQNNNYFFEVVECTKLQTSILSHDIISSQMLYGIIDNQFNFTLIKNHPAHRAKLYAFKFYVALYIGDNRQMQNTLNTIQKESLDWNMLLFELWHGDFNKWLKHLEEETKCQTAFMAIITTNKQDKKLKKLPNFEITQ